MANQNREGYTTDDGVFLGTQSFGLLLMLWWSWLPLRACGCLAPGSLAARCCPCMVRLPREDTALGHYVARKDANTARGSSISESSSSADRGRTNSNSITRTGAGGRTTSSAHRRTTVGQNSTASAATNASAQGTDAGDAKQPQSQQSRAIATNAQSPSHGQKQSDGAASDAKSQVSDGAGVPKSLSAMLSPSQSGSMIPAFSMPYGEQHNRETATGFASCSQFLALMFSVS